MPMIMRIRAPSCGLLLAFALAGEPALADVGGYAAMSARATERASGRRYVVLRSFTQDGIPRRLVVDPLTLSTRRFDASALDESPEPWPALRSAVAGTPYGRALRDAESRRDPLTDAGIDHVRARRDGIDLTIDLCPARRPMDRTLFTALFDEIGRVERPVPVAIAVTGRWMEEHPEDLAWLIGLGRSGALAITWLNHSYTHHVQHTRPLSQSFLLEPGTDLEFEVLGTERALLAHGETPSIFFRFPGLVSSARLFERVIGYGLIPLGSDAWLAKGQWPSAGSIVLVHGNSNEPLGVHRFIELLRRERPNVLKRRWQLLDLSETLAEAERGTGPAPRPRP